MVDPTETPSTALAKIVVLPELVEHILSHVDMYQLFAMQRVCKAFRILILKIRSLQQKMRLSYHPLQAVASLGPADCDICKVLNPLLHQPRKSVALDMFTFELHDIRYPHPWSFDSKIEVLLTATSKRVLGQELVPNTVMLIQGESWLKTKLTNTPAVVCFMMKNVRRATITTFIMEGEDTLADLRDRLKKEVRIYCRARAS